MSQLDALQAAVCAAPEDMAPRRAYAAAVKASDPDRAKVIELQLALREARRADKDPDATVARRDLSYDDRRGGLQAARDGRRRNPPARR